MFLLLTLCRDVQIKVPITFSYASSMVWSISSLVWLLHLTTLQLEKLENSVFKPEHLNNSGYTLGAQFVPAQLG
jgi:hypothetical protein